MCRHHTTRGVWTGEMTALHINYLELMAFFLTLKRFQSMLCGQHVLVQTNNTTVMYYLNKGAETRSSLNQLARNLTLCCVARQISLAAVHLAGVDNVQADRLSRPRVENLCRIERSTEWSLDPRIAHQLFGMWGIPTVDLFATQLNRKVEAFYTHLPDPLALPVDPLVADWSWGLLYL